MNLLKNTKGQGLIEYLVLVCLIAVGSIAVIRVVGKNVRVQFANVSRALGGNETPIAADTVNTSDYSKRDFSDFMTGAGNGGTNNTGGSNRAGGSKPNSGGDVKGTGTIMPGWMGGN